MSMTTSSNNSIQLVHEIQPQSPASRRAKRQKRLYGLGIFGGRVVFFILIVIAWQILHGILGDLFLCSPWAVVLQLKNWAVDGTLWTNTQVTLEETLLGLLFGALAGILGGFVLGLQDLLGKILDPYIIALYSIPKVALAPLFILWFGFDVEMKVILAAVTVFFLVFFNTFTGVRSVDIDLVNAVRLMGGKRRDIMFKVVIPSAAGYVLTGLHMAVPYALVGAVVGEVISVNLGLGYLINDSASTFNPPGVFAALTVLTVIAMVLNGLVNLVDRWTSRWKTGVQTTSRIIPQ